MRAPISLFFIIVVSACTNLAPEIYRHDGDRFRIGHPASFTVRQEKGQAVFSNPSDPDVTVAVGIAPRNEKGRSSARSLASSSQAALTMLRAFPEAKVISERKTKVAGHPANVVDLRFTHDGRRFIRRQFIIEGPTDIAYLGLTTPEERLRLTEGIADAMLDTLQVRGGQS